MKETLGVEITMVKNNIIIRISLIFILDTIQHTYFYIQYFSEL